MNLQTAFQFLVSLFTLKKSYLTVSFLLSGIISLGPTLTKWTSRFDVDNNIVSLILILSLNVFTGILILWDLITGVIASKYEGNKIESGKWGLSVGKFLGLFLFSVLGVIVLLFLSNSYIILVLIYGVMFLSILREYMSIGENIERRYGKKPYVFTAVDKIFDIFEKRFFKYIQDKKALKEGKDSKDSE